MITRKNAIIIWFCLCFGAKEIHNAAIERVIVNNSTLAVANNTDNTDKSSIQYLNRLYSRDNRSKHSCESEIYCHGELLHTVSMAQIFKDSKTFVDMSLKFPPDTILQNFAQFMAKYNREPSSDAVREFVEQNFNAKDDELEQWTPTDWHSSPKFISEVKNDRLRKWANDLNEIWKVLGRKMIANVEEHPELHSIIPVKNPVIVPGGRFSEYYYWDSFWVVKGLLYSEMYDTVKGILNNFLSLVERFGFIPNGGRVYYLNRSQPPFLAAMINAYLEFTYDYDFAIKSVATLEAEFDYFWDNYCRDVKGHKLCSYYALSDGPRPESYREDFELAKDLPTEEAKNELYAHLKAAAESGMDFSSRFFITANGSNQGTLKDTKARDIIAVDLNAYLYRNALIISKFYMFKLDKVKSKKFLDISQQIATGIDAVLWNDTVGCWLDYDTINKKQRNYFAASNLTPLWVKSFNETKEGLAKKIMDYIQAQGLDNFPGGVPNTLLNTNEQWDRPNIWPPMQYLLIEGLLNLNVPESQTLANKWMTRWVQSNYAAFLDEGHMYEKYNADKFGGHGGGGEYETQIGFGWSNGVIIEYLARYGETLKPSSGNSLFNGASTGLLTALLIAVLNRIN